MFGFDKEETGSADRFVERLREHDKVNKPRISHHVWWLVHNCIAHPLIGVCPMKIFFDFHDYTSVKINAK